MAFRTLLVVDPGSPPALTGLRPLLTGAQEVASCELAMERIRAGGVELPDVVVVAPSAASAWRALLDAAREAGPALIVVGALDGELSATSLLEAGAVDFVLPEASPEELALRVQRVVLAARREQGTAPAVVDLSEDPPALIGRSEVLREALSLVERVAPTHSTVLVTGETGTGKELLAGMIHRRSPRARGPYVRVNCAALPETLLEAELFGHERGAYTGAERRRLGRFERADGGTLFLDEVGDLSAATQAKLLRVLQDGEFHRLGGTEPLRADVRVVAATHRDLHEAVRRGEFREDLLFRLDVIRVHLPPLRERGADVELLAEHFLRELGAELGRPRRLGPEARRRLQAHSWPGNLRELRNVIERALLLGEGETLEVPDLGAPQEAVHSGTGPWRPALPSGGLAWDEIERAVVLEALARSGYVQKRAADLLQISRRRLHYIIERLGITHPSWRRNRPPPDPVEDPGIS